MSEHILITLLKDGETIDTEPYAGQCFMFKSSPIVYQVVAVIHDEVQIVPIGDLNLNQITNKETTA